MCELDGSPVSLAADAGLMSREGEPLAGEADREGIGEGEGEYPAVRDRVDRRLSNGGARVVVLEVD